MRLRGAQACGPTALIALVAAGCALGMASRTGVPATGTQSWEPARALARHTFGTQRYEYVFTDETMYVYDLDHLPGVVKTVPLPGVRGIRGVAASPGTRRLYVSYGPDTGPGGHGSLLSLDLVSDAILWRRTYDRGIDSPAIDRMGRRIYMPDGELSHDGVWTVLDAENGNVLGEIDGGLGPHNTVVGPSGRWVYLGGRDYNYLVLAGTASDHVVRRVGPLVSGVRPFTVDARETVAYTTATGFLGFQASSLRTGRVLYTVGFGSRFPYDPATFAPSAPSHGISLSPDGRRVWVIDAPNGYVHVFEVRRLRSTWPRRVADVRLPHGLQGDESSCLYDCARDGWLQHTIDGCMVLVGDSGDVLSAVTLRPVAFLPALRNTRKHLEIDWRNGAPVATSTRQGIGRIGAPPVNARSCRR